MAKYLSGVINYPSVEEAMKSGFTFTEFVVLEKHKDGTASIVHLQNKPVQKGQFEYKGARL
jgi:hypothetical protein